MADFRTHAVAGTAVGVTVYFIGCWVLHKQVTIGGIVLSGLGGLVAGCLPDVLEPALHPNHRSHFHSSVAFLAVTYGGYTAFEDGQLDGNQKLAALVLSAAYVSHLVLDAATPKSLPAI